MDDRVTPDEMESRGCFAATVLGLLGLAAVVATCWLALGSS